MRSVPSIEPSPILGLIFVLVCVIIIPIIHIGIHVIRKEGVIWLKYTTI